MKCPTEFAINDRREGELSKSGLISLVHRKNTDRAAFIGQSLYRPKKYQDEQATACGQYLGPHSLYVRRLALQPLSEMHGARYGRLEPRARPT